MELTCFDLLKKQIKVKLSPKCVSVQESLTASIFSVMTLQSCRSAIVVSSLSLYWFPIVYVVCYTDEELVFAS